MSYTFPKTIDKKELAVELDNCDDEIKWVKENAMGIKDAMVVNGAVVFRNFESMKTQPGE